MTFVLFTVLNILEQKCNKCGLLHMTEYFLLCFTCMMCKLKCVVPSGSEWRVHFESFSRVQVGTYLFYTQPHHSFSILHCMQHFIYSIYIYFLKNYSGAKLKLNQIKIMEKPSVTKFHIQVFHRRITIKYKYVYIKPCVPLFPSYSSGLLCLDVLTT